VLGVFADNHDAAFALDDLAFCKWFHHGLTFMVVLLSLPIVEKSFFLKSCVL
jgi:hypothetical protein